MTIFITELRRRNVFRVSIAYLIVAWLVLQLTDIVAPALRLPDWTMSLVTYLGFVGFPFAILFAWAFELTPEGFKRTADVHPDDSVTHKTGATLNWIIITLLSVAIVGLLADRLTQESGETVVDEAAIDQPLAVTSPSVPIKLKSIAVLPFADMSQSQDQAYMPDGLAEELLNLLAKIPALRVAARTSAFSFKGKDVTIPEIGVQLNVAYVLEGSVRKAGNQIRITAQLIDARTDTHLWSETYTRELKDIFAIQDEIARAVVAELQVTLLGELPSAQRVAPEAYALYLQARHLGTQDSAATSARATPLYRQALEIAPGYAPALIGLAFYSNEGHEQQKEYVNQALASDPDYPPAVALRGIQLAREGDTAAGASWINQALVLDATHIDVLWYAAQMLMALDRSAVDIAEYVVNVDPVNAEVWLQLAVAYDYDDQTDKALQAAQASLRLSPQIEGGHYSVGRILFERGEIAQALEEAQQEPMELIRLELSSVVYHAMGEIERSDALLHELIEKYETTGLQVIARTFYGRGETDRAFEYLHKAAALPSLPWLPSKKDFLHISDDPRWLAFLEKVGRAPHQVEGLEINYTLPAT